MSARTSIGFCDRRSTSSPADSRSFVALSRVKKRRWLSSRIPLGW
ncbi:MAG: hypothetical protein QM820_03100 [Minicystis sp.]